MTEHTVVTPAATGASLQSARPKEVRGYRLRKLSDVSLAFLGWFLFLGAWELAPRLGLVDPVFSSSPSAALSELWGLMVSGTIFPDILATTKIMGIGLALGIVIGVPCGIVFAWFRAADHLTNSVTAALYSLPYVAFVPLVVLWFGIGDTGRIALVTWATVFPVLLNTIGGVRNLDRSFLRVAKGFCAPQFKTITTVVLPGSLPYVLTGVRLAVGRALVCAIVAEFFMSSEGLGYFISNSTAALDMDAAFAALFVTGALGVLLVRLTTIVEDKFSFWTSAE
jgi:ABC-type nitrate/sulfonate/bicarbonate transport system, permease component